MDFDPAAILARVRCPVLLFYGEEDEWTPIEPSVAAWKRAALVSGNADVTVARLAGTAHAPTFGGRHDREAISPEYTRILQDWLDERLASG
jgi:pimeloyl-ACP methyl ester carboxylesterase